MTCFFKVEELILIYYVSLVEYLAVFFLLLFPDC